MLRNNRLAATVLRLWLLNEVLSLNAQEFGVSNLPYRISGILNEVLSLNAQESRCTRASCARASILNEVLSLNAQE